MNYMRVIPRDFFNEAKLLKCMGMLELKILDGNAPKGIRMNDPGTPFEIMQDKGDGSLSVANYQITIKNQYYHFSSIYNSKDNFPFTVTTLEQEDIRVFTEEGEFTQEFINFVTKR